MKTTAGQTDARHVSWHSYRWAALLVAATGIALAGIVHRAFSRSQQARALIEIARRAENHAAAVQTAADRYLEILGSVCAFFDGSEEVRRDEFAAFVRATTSRHPEIQALEWVPRVPHNGRDACEASARADGLTAFRITEHRAQGAVVPAALRAEYFPVCYVEPLTGNEVVVGFDLGSEPTRLAALEKARDSGALVASAPIHLVQETGAEHGFLLFQSVYEGGGVPATVEERRPSLRGFAVGVFRLRNVIDAALSSFPTAGLDLYLLDDNAPAAEQLLYAHMSRSRPEPGTDPGDPLAVEPFDQRLPFRVANQTWTLLVRPTPGVLATLRSRHATTTAAAVLALALSAAGFLLVLGRSAQRSARLAAERGQALELLEVERQRAGESERRYHTLFESSQDAIVTMEPPSWRFTSANKACVAMFGARDEAHLRSLPPWEWSPEVQPDGRASADRAPEIIETAMREGSHFFEWTHKRADGTEFPATVLMTRVELGEQRFLQATVRDITEAKRAQAQVERLHRRNETILNSAGEGIYGVDLEGNTTFVNLAALKCLGYTREELIGKPQHALIHHTRPDGRLYPGEECPVYAAFADGRVHRVADEVFWRKDGTSFPVEYSSNPMRDDRGALIGAVVTFNDITERKRQEAALRETHQILERILGTIPVRVFWKDRNLVYRGCNQVFAHDAGLADPKDIIGKDDFQMVWRDQADLYRSDDLEVMASGRPRLLIEEPQTTPAGDTIWLLTSKVPLQDSEGEVIGVLGTYMDITERKQAEAERLELAKQLQEKQKLAAVGTLACGMGHEINNPIMGIINYAQLIKDRLQGKDGNVEEFAGEIVIEAERIAGIVRGLSAFATRDAAVRVSVPVTDLVESAITPIRATLGDAQITLEVDVPDNLPAIVCDRRQIAQVLTSLLSNARDALNERYPGHDADKKIIVTATPMTNDATQSPMTNDADRRIRAVRLTVEDHGTGIPLDVREHIFEPFYTTKDRSVGAGSVGKGLGLFVSYAVVQEHGGALSVESDPGNWTRFHLDLPTVD